MCGGDADNPQDRRRRRVDSRRRGGHRARAAAGQQDSGAFAADNNADAAAALAAIDAPPPVASPTGPSPSSSAIWHLRELQHQTPQHLTTLRLDDDDDDDDDESAPQHESVVRDVSQLDDQHPQQRQQPRGAPTTAASVLIVGERYLAVGTDQGTVAVWDLATVLAALEASSSFNNADVAPHQRSEANSAAAFAEAAVSSPPLTAPSSSSSSPRFVDLRRGDRRGPEIAAGRVVGMGPYRDRRFLAAAGAEAATGGPDRLVLVATEWGVVAVVDAARGEVLCRFETGRCSATCVAAVAATTPTSSSPTILVGYQTGILECWTLRHVGSAGMAAGSVTLPKPLKRFKALLLARGSCDSGFPVRSIAAIPVPPSAPEGVGLTPQDPSVSQDDAPPPIASSSTGPTVAQESPEASKAAPAYAVVTLESNRPMSVSRTVMVVDAASLVVAFSRRNRDEDGENNERTVQIRMEDHQVHPGTGREPVDWSLPFAARTPFQAPWIPSAGTNQAVTIPGIGVAVCSADGTVAMFREFSNPGGADGCAWGIGDRSDQLLLSYPAIGIGFVSLPSLEPDDRATTTEHLVCCLRGGTAYFASLDPDVSATNGNEESQLRPPRPLKVVTYPSDLDTDVVAVQQVQVFAAGNVRPSSHQGRAIPILVYAWPGGIIDVYSCQLHTRTWSRRGLLQQLVDNGSARLLQQLLLSGNANASTRGPLWADAKKELLRRMDANSHSEDSKLTVDESLTVTELEGHDLQAVRTLLLQLATSATITS